MKTSIIKYSHLLLILVAVFLSTSSSTAQKKKKTLTVSSSVVDMNGEAIADATIYVNDGSLILRSNADGSFTADVKEGSSVVVEADGYKAYTWSLSTDPALDKIELQGLKLFTTKDDKIALPLNKSVDKRYLVGAVSTIKSKELEKYNDPLLSNTLQGMASGLNIVMQTGGMANNSSSVYVRGLSRASNNAPIYLVDGVERAFDDINPEEVETIEVLKDATAKILYGARAANGIILVTTKRGEAHKRVINTKVDFGAGLSTFTPEYLDSYDYATLYNRARANDGLTPSYSSTDLEGYENSTGENDLLYPNVDYFDYFLRNYTTYKKATTEVSGGNETARYALLAGYMGYKGLQDVGDVPSQDRFNVRANLDVDINDFIDGYINMSVIIDSWKYSGLDHSSTFSALSSHRPNEYPLIIGEEYIPATDKGVPALGASDVYTSNLLGSMLYSGDGNDQFINQQMTTGLNFDLSNVLEGLSASTFIAFDNYFYGQQKIQPTPATYVPSLYASSDNNGQDSVTFRQVQDLSIDSYYNLTDNSTLRTTAFNGCLDFNKTIAEGQLDASLGYYSYLNESKGGNQDVRNDNFYLRSNYVYKDKYIAELDLALMGSNRFADGNRHFLSYAAGVAWLLSEESFMDGDVFDYLKLKTSYGLLGYDAATTHFLYENRWTSTGTAQFGEKNNGTDASRTKLTVLGNPDLEWEKSREINVGLEGLAFDQRLWFEFNYFNEFRYDMVGIQTENFSSASGEFRYYTNYAEVANQGVELEVNFADEIGDFSYAIGANMTYSKNKYVTKDEVDYTESRTTEGLPTDVIMGYASTGLFGKDVDLASAPFQTFGAYTDGYLAYEDQNGDNMITDLDKVVIGNSIPRTTVGLDLQMTYKNWGLYALFTGSFGVYKQYTSTYFRNNGNQKYSVLANDAYHELYNPEGNQPSLTTSAADNNTVTSDYWTKRSDFVRLKNVELSYTLIFAPTHMVKESKFFVRANNVLTFSNIDDVDPEVPTAGITNYPLLRMVTGGVAVSF